MQKPEPPFRSSRHAEWSKPSLMGQSEGQQSASIQYCTSIRTELGERERERAREGQRERKEKEIDKETKGQKRKLGREQEGPRGI